RSGGARDWLAGATEQAAEALKRAAKQAAGTGAGHRCWPQVTTGSLAAILCFFLGTGE
ncbi:unnamed protein product, partial [Effrenium voratum]